MEADAGLVPPVRAMVWADWPPLVVLPTKRAPGFVSMYPTNRKRQQGWDEPIELVDWSYCQRDIADAGVACRSGLGHRRLGDGCDGHRRRVAAVAAPPVVCGRSERPLLAVRGPSVLLNVFFRPGGSHDEFVDLP